MLNNSFKKFIALLISILMIMTSLPITALAATSGTLNNTGFGLAVGGSESRWDGTQLNIVNDGEANNTSAGIVKFDISALAGKNVTSATLTATVDSWGADSSGLTFYYSTNVASQYINNGQTQNLGWGAGTGTYANQVFGDRLGFYTDGTYKTVGSIAKNNNASLNMTSIMQDLAGRDIKTVYIIVMQTQAGQTSSANGWSDTKMKPANFHIAYTYDGDYDLATAAQLAINSTTTLNASDYGSFNNDNTNDWASGKNYNSYMKNVLYGQKSTGAEDSNCPGTNCNGWDTYAQIMYPAMVFAYDGTTSLNTPVLIACWNNRDENKFGNAAVLNTAGLAYTDSYWHGTDTSNNWVWLYSKQVNQDRGRLGTTTSALTAQSIWGSKNGWGTYSASQFRSANMIKFTGSFASGEYLKQIKPSFTYYASPDSGNPSLNDNVIYLNCKKNINIVNFKALTDKQTAAKSQFATVKNNASRYTADSLNAYYTATKNLGQFVMPTKGSEDADTYAVNCANSIKSVVEDYDTAYNALVEVHSHTYYDNWTTVTPATCQNKGLAERYCTVATCPDKAGSRQTMELDVDSNAHTYDTTKPTPVIGSVTKQHYMHCTECNDYFYNDCTPGTPALVGAYYVTSCTECGQEISKELALDYTAFNAAKEDAAAINIAGMTADSIDAFNAEVAAAIAQGNAATNQTELDAATTRLEEAYTKLVKEDVTYTITVKVEVDGETTGSTTYTGKYADTASINVTDTLTNAKAYKWTIEQNGSTTKIGLTDSVYEMYITGDATVTVYASKTVNEDATQKKVTVLDKSGKTIGVSYVSAETTLNKTEETIAGVTAPKVAFYTFSEWVEVKENTFKASYDLPASTCNIHLEDGLVLVKGEDEYTDEYTAYYDEVLNVKSDVQLAISSKADHSDAVLVKYNSLIHAPKANDAYIFVAPAELVASAQVTGIYKQDSSASFNVIVNASDYEIVECGIYAIRSADAINDSFTFNPLDSRAVKIRSNSQSENGEFTVTINSTTNFAGYKTVYGMPYVVYNNGGELVEVTGSVVGIIINE